MESSRINSVLEKSIHWFCHSSIMNPSSGFWGVAERIFLSPDEKMKKSVFLAFNSFTDYGDWSVVESRRADCNFQVAYLFLLAAELGKADCRPVAENMLDFLYFRSGLLHRGAYSGRQEGLDGVWNWSHTLWNMNLWLDDNAWSLLIPLQIMKREPALVKRYDMAFWAEKLADQIAVGFGRTFHACIGKEEKDLSDPDGIWYGRPLHPHWGSLCCLALAAACHAGFPKAGEYAVLIREYHEFLAGMAPEKWNVSKLAYALIGATAAYRAFAEPFYLKLTESFADRILAKADPVTGNVPAEHYEAPTGPHLMDTIYTVNWVLMGFQNLVRILPDRAEYRQQYEQMLNLFADIQDKSPKRQFNGCWRGMYDMKAKSWGGGNCTEGGAGSIYSGWTNAPAAIVFAHELAKTSLID